MTPDTISATPRHRTKSFWIQVRVLLAAAARFVDPIRHLGGHITVCERIAQFTCGALWIKWHAGSVFSLSRAS
jgi:hypothetical protein